MKFVPQESKQKTRSEKHQLNICESILSHSVCKKKKTVTWFVERPYIKLREHGTDDHDLTYKRCEVFVRLIQVETPHKKALIYKYGRIRDKSL
jgi:hypothetical protein